MEYKELSKDEIIGMLKIASALIYEHGVDVGDKVCQDWSIEECNPFEVLTKESLAKLKYNYEIDNSGLEDYSESPEDDFNDEMLSSFIVGHNINLFIGKLEGDKE